MKVRIVQAPYDSGRRGLRMGRGPEHLMDNGLRERLRAGGHEVRAEVVEPGNPFPTEIATAFELHRLVAGRVRDAAGRDELPLVLSGNCNTSSVGTLAGLGPEEVGVVWFDVHADFNTPETTTSGFLDGMGLSIAVGDCWRGMTGTIPGFRPVREASVVHVGARDIEPAERERLERSWVMAIQPFAQGRMREALDALRDRVRRVYVHLDLDVLDADRVGPANEYAKAGGLTTEEVVRAIRMIQGRFDLAAAGVASFDPAYDEGGCVSRAGLDLVEALVAGHEG